MAFNFGFQNPTNPTNQQSSGYGYGIGESFGSSFDQSSNFSSSKSWQDPDQIWGPQAAGLENLFGAGASIFQNAGMGPGMGIFNTAQQGFQNLMNPGVNPQLQAYQGDVMRNMQRNILPSIEGGAGMAGQLGGARQGIAEGLAMSDANQQVTDMAANLYNSDMNRMMTTRAQAPMLANLGMGLPWFNAQQYAGLLGRPTVLGGGGGSESMSSGSSLGGSSDYGYGIDYNENQATSTGGGGGGGFDFGFGI